MAQFSGLTDARKEDTGRRVARDSVQQESSTRIFQLKVLEMENVLVTGAASAAAAAGGATL